MNNHLPICEYSVKVARRSFQNARSSSILTYSLQCVSGVKVARLHSSNKKEFDSHSHAPFIQNIKMKYQYDRPAIKLEFFESDIDEVQPFFIQNYNKDTAKNKQLATATKWRAKEKQERKARIVEKAIERNAEKQAKELSVPLEDLMKWKKAVLQLLLKQVSRFVNANKWEDWKDIDVWDAEKILKMFKTELGEPATIWANYNMNANKVEWLTDEESEALDILFNEKIWKNKKQ